jgi:hypothetical protein
MFPVEAIIEFLKATPGQSYSDRQVSRAVDWNYFREDQFWARPYLETLVRMHKLVVDHNGWFRYPTSDRHIVCPVPTSTPAVHAE